jgi:hypothetical protein
MHVAAVAMTAAKFSGAPESRRVGIDLAAWWTVCRRYGP